MASWLERVRPTISEALAAVSDRIDTELQAELQERDNRRHAPLRDEIASLRSRTALVDRLEQENRSLKAELLQLRSEHARTTVGPNATSRTPLGEISSNKPAIPPKRRSDSESEVGKSSADLRILRTEYQNFRAKYAGLKKSYEDLRTCAKKFRDDRDRWLKYAESLEAKVKKLENKVGEASKPEGRPSFTESSNPASTSDEGSAVETKSTRTVAADQLGKEDAARVHSASEASASFSAGDHQITEKPPSRRRAISTPIDLPGPSSPISAGQHWSSTEDESAYATEETVLLPRLPQNAVGSVVIKNEPSSDEPVFVSERGVRKRKADDLAWEQATPRRIKNENSSSEPAEVPGSDSFSPQESIDLDNGRGPMATPRKRRVLGGGEAAPVDGSEEDNLESTTLVEGCHPEPGNVTNVQSHQGVFAEPQPTPNLVRPSVSNSSTDKSTTGSDATSTSARRRHVRSNYRIDELAESGGTSFYQTEELNAGVFPHQALAAESRLDTLLNNPSPENHTVLLRPNRRVRQTRQAEDFDILVPPRELPFGKGDRRNATRTPNATRNVDRKQENSKPAPRPRRSETTAAKTSNAASLRLRPRESLGLDDFRINPKFNDGHSYAFSEVVRNKSDRAELPGCTDPQCCGKHFRAMAQAELQAVGPSLVYRAADIKLLEEYLGDQAHRLGLMNRLEKEELWLEAKTRELANKHGKHRHRFSRRQSPPGFWDADFPSTQEMQREREEVEERVKRLVEERWREAMRPGGRWLFRDE